MTQLTSVHGTFRANVLAARLTDEGFDVELRGAVASPYSVTMGDLARVDVFVPSEQMDDARYVMLVNDVEDALDDSVRSRRAPWQRVAAGVAIAALLYPVVRVLGRLAAHLVGAE